MRVVWPDLSARWHLYIGRMGQSGRTERAERMGNGRRFGRSLTQSARRVGEPIFCLLSSSPLLSSEAKVYVKEEEDELPGERRSHAG